MVAFLHKFTPRKGEAEAETATEPIPAPSGAQDLEIQAAAPEITAVNEKGAEGGPDDNDLKQEMELPDLDAQRGVQKVEAVTLSWNKKSLACLLILYVFMSSPSH